MWLQRKAKIREVNLGELAGGGQRVAAGGEYGVWKVVGQELAPEGGEHQAGKRHGILKGGAEGRVWG